MNINKEDQRMQYEEELKEREEERGRIQTR